MLLSSNILIATTLLAFNNCKPEQERPNILWITCEDISPYLGSYGCMEALTPNLDKLATEGIRYTHAYAEAPVCAVSRSALLTGMHSTTLGTHQMRSMVQLPESIPAYPRVFREAGYYCTNNAKEDYNSNFQKNPTVWDESSNKAHYRNRKENQPFFAVFNIMVTHESQLSGKDGVHRYFDRSLLPENPRVDPMAIELPPYHPDLPEIRFDWARLHDLITLMDSLAGDLLRELDESGLADNTIVIFYSDHGGMLSRSKRYIYNVGTQVPLIVRFPEKLQHLAPANPGSTIDQLVTFTDIPKTTISLAGLEVPELMQGRIFSGPKTEPAPGTVHFYRDRMGERYDFSRAVTDGRYYYIRNFMPHRPRGRDAVYGPNVQYNWEAWEKQYDSGLCNEIQSQFYQSKPLVELFDTEKDPWHVNNLAGFPEYKEKIAELENDLDQWMLDTRDLGLVPEPLFYELVGPEKEYKTLYEYGQSNAYNIERILQVAKESSRGEPGLIKKYLENLNDEDPVVRHWSAYALFLAHSPNGKVQKALKKMMEADPMAANRIMAAQALALNGDPEAAFASLYKEAALSSEGYVFLLALNAFQYGKIDDKLELEDWKILHNKKFTPSPGADQNGIESSKIIIETALKLWPERSKVY
jgi:N-sulfoglucosamine sulfohydrolase